jgi:hypothetical protein
MVNVCTFVNHKLGYSILVIVLAHKYGSRGSKMFKYLYKNIKISGVITESNAEQDLIYPPESVYYCIQTAQLTRAC